jgi:hypothetical protein
MLWAVLACSVAFLGRSLIPLPDFLQGPLKKRSLGFQSGCRAPRFKSSANRTEKLEK